jgi:hypothetical protein
MDEDDGKSDISQPNRFLRRARRHVIGSETMSVQTADCWPTLAALARLSLQGFPNSFTW